MLTSAAAPMLFALRMLVAGAFVVVASRAAERAGPLVGGLVATLPISAGPAYVFLALDHGAAFVAESALASLVTTAGTALFSLTYAALAERRGLAAGLGLALAAWFAVNASARLVSWSFLGAALFCMAVALPCVLLSRRFRFATMPKPAPQWYDMPLRAGMVALLIGILTAVSPLLGPAASGMIAVFPVVLTTLILILHPRVGAKPTAAVMANTIPGLIGFATAVSTLHLTAVPLGAPIGLSLALAASVGANLLIFAARRRGLPI